MNITYTDGCYDYYKGQNYCKLKATSNDEIVGYIDYSIYQKEIFIDFIFVNEKYRRLGIATGLMNKLKEDNKGTKINHSLQTPLGHKFVSSLKESITPPKHKEFKKPDGTLRWRIEKNGLIWDRLQQNGKWVFYLVCPKFKDIIPEKPTDEELKTLIENGRSKVFPYYVDYQEFCNKTGANPKRLFSVLKYIQVNMQNEYKLQFAVNRMGSNSSFRLDKKKINELLSLVGILLEQLNSNIKYVESEDEDITTINAIDKNTNKKIGMLDFEVMFSDSSYWYFEGDFSEDKYEKLFPKDFVKISDITVEPEYRKYGIAMALMKKAEEKIKSMGYKIIYLNASPMGFGGLNVGNLVSFYKMYGFKVILNQGHNIQMMKKI